MYQNAANCMTIHFHYVVQPGGVAKPTAHAHLLMCDKIMESLRTFVFVETVLRYGSLFQSDKV